MIAKDKAREVDAALRGEPEWRKAARKYGCPHCGATYRSDAGGLAVIGMDSVWLCTDCYARLPTGFGRWQSITR